MRVARLRVRCVESHGRSIRRIRGAGSRKRYALQSRRIANAIRTILLVRGRQLLRVHARPRQKSGPDYRVELRSFALDRYCEEGPRGTRGEAFLRASPMERLGNTNIVEPQSRVQPVLLSTRIGMAA